MTTKRRGLGKGLNELLATTLGVGAGTKNLTSPQDERIDDEDHLDMLEGSMDEHDDAGLSAPAATDRVPGSLKQLPIDLIRTSPFQPRHVFKPEALESLAESIKLQGVLQPVVVRVVANGDYELVAGERRWRAAQLAGLSNIPAIVKDLSDQAAMAIGLIENIQRENLNPIEEAKAFQRLSEEMELTHLQVAEAVGRSRAAITNTIRLLSLEAETQEMLAKGEIEMGHARALLSLRGPMQKQVAKTIAARGLSVREAERIVARLQEDATAPKKKTLIDPNIRRLENTLADKLGSTVFIRHTQKGAGTVVIGYSSLDELEGILGHIQ